LKRVLIISPYFPPSNAADMQRVRMSLPYFGLWGWTADVVCVDQKHSQVLKDEALLQSLPTEQVIYEVDAWSLKWTAKIGLGSLALRSMWYYLRTVNGILRNRNYDLIYFSTTQFPLTILGRYWKHKFNIPYVIDMQDPWHSEYYQDKPKSQRPPKYWFSYRLHKFLEPIAMKKVDGLISVSTDYITDLRRRYLYLKDIPAATITFGYFLPDQAIARQQAGVTDLILERGTFNIVYIGRGGQDMHRAIIPVFKALKRGLSNSAPLFEQLRLYFIGTSYAPGHQGIATILPLAKAYGLQQFVTETTNRLSYYHTLLTLQQADALFIPGSDDARYTASKLYPYLLMRKPLMTIFHEDSPAVGVLEDNTEHAVIVTFADDREASVDMIYETLHHWACGICELAATLPAFDQFDAKALTGKQVSLFEKAISHFKERP
jgi:hypothetical protein